MTPLLLDLSHTSHTRARTGIQRVCRSLHTALAGRMEGVRAVCYDPYEGAWRSLRGWERRNLAGSDTTVAAARGARWPWWARLAGGLRRGTGRRSHCALRAADCSGGLVVPEVFSPPVGRALPALLARVVGPRVAIFHDAIALRLPELSPPKSVARFPSYLQELLAFDGVAAVSEDSRQALVDYWRWLGAANPPPVVVLPPGIDTPVPSPYGQASAPDAVPVVLCLGSIEGRKNHGALLDACELLWSRGRRFELRLIGLAHPQTGRTVLARIRTLQAAGRPLRYDGAVADAVVQSAYRTCRFTVYPSLMEGFGLPVLESLSYGKPCICSAHGPLGESARGGGAFPLEHVDAPGLAGAIERLLTDPECLEVLTAATAGRTFRAWPAYAREFVTWMQSLPRR
ncbi:MAG: glycosyltransferase [Opitutaceae bacterium]